MSQEDLEILLAFFKALSNESRLKIVGLLARREASVDELAALLSLRAPTVSHHLSILKAQGLVDVRPEGTTSLYRLRPERLKQLSRRVLAPDAFARVASHVDVEAFDRKVLRAFVEDERLTSIPTTRKKRAVILRWLVEKVEPDHRYGELELNALIKRHHPDAATLRRELVGCGLLQRERSVYWRPAPA